MEPDTNESEKTPRQPQIGDKIVYFYLQINSLKLFVAKICIHSTNGTR